MRRRRPLICGRPPQGPPKSPVYAELEDRRYPGCLPHQCALRRSSPKRWRMGTRLGLGRLAQLVWGSAAWEASGGASCANLLSGPPVCCTSIAVRRAPNALWTRPNSIRLSSHDPTRLWRESHGRVLIPSHERPTRTIARDGGIQSVSQSVKSASTLALP